MGINNDTPTRRVGDVQLGILIGQVRQIDSKVDYLTKRLDTCVSEIHAKCNGRHIIIERDIKDLSDEKVSYKELWRFITLGLILIGVFIAFQTAKKIKKHFENLKK